MLSGSPCLKISLVSVRTTHSDDGDNAESLVIYKPQVRVALFLTIFR